MVYTYVHNIMHTILLCCRRDGDHARLLKYTNFYFNFWAPCIFTHISMALNHFLAKAGVRGTMVEDLGRRMMGH